MADLLIRGIDDQVVARLKARAKRNGRSLQAEVRLILEQAARSEEIAIILDGCRQQRLGGRRFPDCTNLIREDRNR